jgi:hypothetical protein
MSSRAGLAGSDVSNTGPSQNGLGTQIEAEPKPSSEEDVFTYDSLPTSLATAESTLKLEMKLGIINESVTSKSMPVQESNDERPQNRTSRTMTKYERLKNSITKRWSTGKREMGKIFKSFESRTKAASGSISSLASKTSQPNVHIIARGDGWRGGPYTRGEITHRRKGRRDISLFRLADVILFDNVAKWKFENKLMTMNDAWDHFGTLFVLNIKFLM